MKLALVTILSLLAAPQPGPAADEAALVVVVRSPAVIVRERAARPSAPPEAAVHAGVAVDKEVAAATIVPFPTPSSELSELDREAVDGVARAAASARCELLVWARAKDRSLTAEAQRRATELQTRVIAYGPLAPVQVVTRITTHPGVDGVDVVVSALREAAKAPAPASGGPALLPGESGKRQIREAVQAVQPSIAACLAPHVARSRLARGASTVKVTVAPAGHVIAIRTVDGDFVGVELDACLAQAARAWRFPAAEGPYAADVPLSVLQRPSRR